MKLGVGRCFHICEKRPSGGGAGCAVGSAACSCSCGCEHSASAARARATTALQSCCHRLCGMLSSPAWALLALFTTSRAAAVRRRRQLPSAARGERAAAGGCGRRALCAGRRLRPPPHAVNAAACACQRFMLSRYVPHSAARVLAAADARGTPRRRAAAFGGWLSATQLSPFSRFPCLCIQLPSAAVLRHWRGGLSGAVERACKAALPPCCARCMRMQSANLSSSTPAAAAPQRPPAPCLSAPLAATHSQL